MAPRPDTPVPTMTTPFFQPASCQSIFSSTRITQYHLMPHSIYTYSLVPDPRIPLTTLPVLVSNSADPRFSACQPSGWDRNGYPFSFTPAVCPSGWVMYRAQAYDVYYDHHQSGAYCCASGYTINTGSKLLGSYTLLSNTYLDVRCVSSIQGPAPSSAPASAPATTTATSTGSSSSEETSGLSPNTLYPAGIAIHHPYVIEWSDTEQDKLSPRPPDLPCDATLATWAPGSPVPTESLQCSPGFEERRRSANQHQTDNRYEGLLIMVIVLPIVGFLIICACVGCCIHSAIRKNRIKRAEHWKANQKGTIYATLAEAREALRAAAVNPEVEVGGESCTRVPDAAAMAETEVVEEAAPVGATTDDGGRRTHGPGKVVQTDGR